MQIINIKTEKGVDHVKKYLLKAGDRLSELVARDMSDGSLDAIVPLEGQVSRADLEKGGATYDPDELYQALADVVRQFLQKSNSIALFEYSAGEHWESRRPKCDFFIFPGSRLATWDGKEWRQWPYGMAIFLKGKEFSEQKLRTFMEEVAWSLRTGFMCIADGTDVHSSNEVSEEFLIHLSRQTQSVIVPAYGQELFAIWHREHSANL